jgi:hypothetical protein
LVPGGDGQSSWLGSRRGKDLLNLLRVNQLWDILAMELLQRIDCIILIASFACFMYFLILFDVREKSGTQSFVFLFLHTRVGLYPCHLTIALTSKSFIKVG